MSWLFCVGRSKRRQGQRDAKSGMIVEAFKSCLPNQYFPATARTARVYNTGPLWSLQVEHSMHTRAIVLYIDSCSIFVVRCFDVRTGDCWWHPLAGCVAFSGWPNDVRHRGMLLLLPSWSIVHGYHSNTDCRHPLY